MNQQAPMQSVGVSVQRSDAAAKTSGKSIYTADIELPGMLHAKVLRSGKAHARIVSINATKARRMPGVLAVLTRDDLPDGRPDSYGYFIKDQPIVALDKVRYEGDVIVAVAGVDEGAANRALATIEIEYEDLPPVPDMAAALAADACELFEDAPLAMAPAYGLGASGELRPAKNVCYAFRYETGDAGVFDQCDHIFEDTFEFSRMNHFHLEPFVAVANWTDDVRLEIWSSCQNPFPVRKELARLFTMAETDIAVQVPFVGGGYGSKNGCKNEPIAALLSKMSGRPVRYCATIEEGFLINTQHAARLRLRTGVMADGRLMARQSEIHLDAGAYSDGSPLVAEKAGYRIPGPYRYHHIDSVCHCVMTNTAPAGPFRGFGGTQATWASESQIDMIAHRLGMDPFDMRMKNLINAGEPFVPGESAIDSDLRQGLELVAAEIGYHDRQRKPNRGIGVAIGFKDGGGVNKPAQARVKVSTNGDIFLYCGTIEIGQGAQSAMSQVVAEIMCVPPGRVRYMAVNTDTTPFCQGTNASSGVAVMGQAVAHAADELKKQVLDFAAGQLQCAADDLRLDDWSMLKGNERFSLAPMVMGHYGGTGFEFTADGFHKAESDHGAPLETQCVFWEVSWSAVEIEVDPETGQINIEKLVVSGDAGRAINPSVCRGQDEGSAVMGIGQTLFEEMLYDGTSLVNGEALRYRVPLAQDLPESFISITQEQGLGPGPFGAKGMGEGGILPIAPAVANALEDALGVRVSGLPLTPERVLDALNKAKQ